MQLNMWEFWDLLHGGNRDVWLTKGSCEMKSLALLHLMVINIAHWLDESDLRFKQIVDYMSDHYNDSAPQVSRIFQDNYPEIVKKMGDLVQQGDGETMQDAVWRFCKTYIVYRKQKATNATLAAMVQSSMMGRHCSSFGPTFSLKHWCQHLKVIWSRRSSWTGSD